MPNQTAPREAAGSPVAAAIARFREYVERLAAEHPDTAAEFVQVSDETIFEAAHPRGYWMAAAGLHGSAPGNPTRAVFVRPARAANVSAVRDAVASVLKRLGRLVPGMPSNAVTPRTRACPTATMRGACALIDLALVSERPELHERCRWHDEPGVVSDGNVQIDFLRKWSMRPGAGWSIVVPDLFGALAVALQELVGAPRLTELQAQVLEIIHRNHDGIQGKAIIEAVKLLYGKVLSQATLTKHIIPKLRRQPWNVENVPGCGYRIRTL